MVVINSTVGLSAISQGIPVKACGKVIYDIKGLTFQGLLDDFWQQSQLNKPDLSLFDEFQNYLMLHTQLNGSFYKRLPITASATGLCQTKLA